MLLASAVIFPNRTKEHEPIQRLAESWVNFPYLMFLSISAAVVHMGLSVDGSILDRPQHAGSSKGVQRSVF